MFTVKESGIEYQKEKGTQTSKNKKKEMLTIEEWIKSNEEMTY